MIYREGKRLSQQRGRGKWVQSIQEYNIKKKAITFSPLFYFIGERLEGSHGKHGMGPYSSNFLPASHVTLISAGQAPEGGNSPQKEENTKKK